MSANWECGAMEIGGYVCGRPMGHKGMHRRRTPVVQIGKSTAAHLQKAARTANPRPLPTCRYHPATDGGYHMVGEERIACAELQLRRTLWAALARLADDFDALLVAIEEIEDQGEVAHIFKRETAYWPGETIAAARDVLDSFPKGGGIA